MKIAIFEDDPLFRDGLKWLLSSQPGFEVVGAFADASGLEGFLAAAKPDILLLDFEMPPGPNGLEALRLAKRLRPEIQVIMVTLFDGENLLFDAIRAGANGYLLKTGAQNQIVEAVRAVAEGGSPMTPRMAARLLEHFRGETPAAVVPQNSGEANLSKREKEILRSLSKGYSHKEIAEEFHLSLLTVRNHLRSIYSKLQVHSMTEAAVKALNEGLV